MRTVVDCLRSACMLILLFHVNLLPNLTGQIGLEPVIRKWEGKAGLEFLEMGERKEEEEEKMEGEEKKVEEEVED